MKKYIYKLFRLLKYLLAMKNIQYAAQLIKQLYQKHGNWQQAIAYYHSSIPNHNIKYKQEVMSCWLGAGKVKNS